MLFHTEDGIVVPAVSRRIADSCDFGFEHIVGRGVDRHERLLLFRYSVDDRFGHGGLDDPIGEVRHLQNELERTLAYLEEVDSSRSEGDA